VGGRPDALLHVRPPWRFWKQRFLYDHAHGLRCGPTMKPSCLTVPPPDFHRGHLVMRKLSAMKKLEVVSMVLIALTGAGTALCGQTACLEYVSNAGCVFGNVSAYTIDGTTGALTPVAGSPFPAGMGPISVTVDPTGQFAYVANRGSDFELSDVSAYTIDGTTGALTPVVGSPFPA